MGSLLVGTSAQHEIIGLVDLIGAHSEHRRRSGFKTDSFDGRMINMNKSAGRKCWIIADGYIPPASTGNSRQLMSHDAMCILNSGDQDAHIDVTIFFADREPAGPYNIIVKASRTKHVRFNEFTDPEPIPHDTDYASIIESDVPIVVQHTRLDSRQSALALMSTIAYPISN